eukprot:7708980-Alexandrium_andersonii.AAC.1
MVLANLPLHTLLSKGQRTILGAERVPIHEIQKSLEPWLVRGGDCSRPPLELPQVDEQPGNGGGSKF